MISYQLIINRFRHIRAEVVRTIKYFPNIITNPWKVK